VTYTQNWPHEELIGNHPTTAAIMWSMASVFLLLAGIGGMIWYFGSKQTEHTTPPASDPLLETRWLRAFGDSCFTVGALALAWFIVTLALDNRRGSLERVLHGAEAGGLHVFPSLLQTGGR
jgi:nitric oxide reductase large subunit